MTVYIKNIRSMSLYNVFPLFSVWTLSNIQSWQRWNIGMLNLKPVTVSLFRINGRWTKYHNALMYTQQLVKTTTHGSI